MSGYERKNSFDKIQYIRFSDPGKKYRGNLYLYFGNTNTKFSNTNTIHSDFRILKKSIEEFVFVFEKSEYKCISINNILHGPGQAGRRLSRQAGGRRLATAEGPPVMDLRGVA